MKINRTEKISLGVALGFVLFNLLLWGGIGWAAIHFIRKFW